MSFLKLYNFPNKEDELEKKNIKIKRSRSELNLIKETAIKDLIYSHKNVPTDWKKRPNYQNQVSNLIANDENFLIYLGNIGGKQESTKYNKSTYGENDKSGNEAKMTKNYSRKIKLFRNNSMDERELDIYLTKLGKNFPIKGKLKDLFDNKILMSIESKNKLIDDNKSKLIYKYITSEKKKNDINKNIFVHLIPSKPIPKKYKIKRAQSAFNYYNKKNSNKNVFKRKKINIKDRYAMNQLTSINFFGPYFSYCPDCGNKNIDFYQNMNTNTLIEIVGQIKKNKDEEILRKLKHPKKIIKDI